MQPPKDDKWPADHARTECGNVRVSVVKLADRQPQTSSPKAKLMKLSFHARLPVLLLAALCATQIPARAGDAEDCAGQLADKIEPACTAIIDRGDPRNIEPIVNALVVARARADLHEVYRSQLQRLPEESVNQWINLWADVVKQRDRGREILQRHAKP